MDYEKQIHELQNEISQQSGIIRNQRLKMDSLAKKPDSLIREKVNDSLARETRFQDMKREEDRFFKRGEFSVLTAGDLKNLLAKEKGRYIISFDHEASMSGICYFVVSTVEKKYSCFTDYELKEINCDTTFRSTINVGRFDTLVGGISRILSFSGYRDKSKLKICGVNGFGFISEKQSISCEYTTIKCDSCKYEKLYPSNSCKEDGMKNEFIEDIRKLLDRLPD